MTREEQHLLYTVRGLRRMLHDCCDGRNVHEVAALRTALNLMEGLLERGPGPSQLESLRRNVARVKRQACAIYSAWDRLRRAG